MWAGFELGGNKMTNKEAIETIKIAMAEVEWDYPMDYTVAFEKAVDALEKQMNPKWNKTSEIKPTEEKEYLCCSIYNNGPYFTVLGWSNGLYEVSEFDFYDHKGESGFYSYDSEWGYIKSDCDYWQEIEWEDEE